MCNSSGHLPIIGTTLQQVFSTWFHFLVFTPASQWKLNHVFYLAWTTGFASHHPETTLKSRRNPTSPRDNTCQSLGLIFPCNKVLMVDPEPSLKPNFLNSPQAPLLLCVFLWHGFLKNPGFNPAHWPTQKPHIQSHTIHVWCIMVYFAYIITIKMSTIHVGKNAPFFPWMVMRVLRCASVSCRPHWCPNAVPTQNPSGAANLVKDWPMGVTYLPWEPTVSFIF